MEDAGLTGGWVTVGRDGRESTVGARGEAEREDVEQFCVGGCGEGRMTEEKKARWMGEGRARSRIAHTGGWGRL